MDNKLADIVAKLGLKLKYNPNGFFNRCFYQCIAKALGKNEVGDLIDDIQNFMMNNQVLAVVDENGDKWENTDLFGFLSDADFQSRGSRPETWKEAVVALRNEMTTHAVIVSTAHLYCMTINIVHQNGRITKIIPDVYHYDNTSFVWLAYTGSHYMLLTNKEDESEDIEIDEDEVDEPMDIDEDWTVDLNLFQKRERYLKRSKRLKRLQRARLKMAVQRTR